MTLTIGEVARRSGVPATTLRYYEDVGLLPGVARTPAGYRQYEESVLARLTFVTRAKELDCTLEEIADLVRAWDGEDCADVQHRLRLLVREKIDAADQRLRDLIALTADLRTALGHLESLEPTGTCGADCACLLPTPPVDERRLVGPMLGSPVACTLPVDDAPGRLADWQAVLADVVDRTPTDDGLRLTLGPGTDLAEVGRLLVAEHGCCSFLGFALTVDGRGVALEVTAPPDARELADELFGAVSA